VRDEELSLELLGRELDARFVVHEVVPELVAFNHHAP